LFHVATDEAIVIVPGHIPADVREVCMRLRAAGHQAHLVGGGVRDLLLGRVPADFDVATDAHPERVMQLFGARFAVPTGLQHGTVTVLTEPQSSPAGSPGGQGAGAPGDRPARRHVEVTTFRGEGAYLDGRRPSSVTYVSSLEEDLGRRDFTMNAVAYDPVSGVLTDPHGGREDLRRRLIRAVGDPVQRFREDGLRPMRAVRLATQLELDVDPPTLGAIPVTLGVFRRVSAERIRDELLKLLAAPRPSRGIELLRRTGLLGEVLPELLECLGVEQNRFHKHDVYVHTLATVDATPGDAITRLGALLHDIGKPRARQPGAAPREHTFYGHEEIGARMADAVARRLKLGNADRERVVALVAHHMFFYTPDWSDGTVRRFVRRVGAELLPSLFALRHGDVVARGFGEDPRVELGPLEGRIAQVAAGDAVLRVADLAIGGRDVMRILGIGPGPRVGRLLEALLERVVDDASLNEPARLEVLLRELEATISA
jgi:tRNA nucleotidyltransferase (CCA-adding enzyme)